METTLVVDGNWLLMSRFFMKRDSFRKEFDDETKESSSEQLADLMAQSISVVLRQFANQITNVIFVSDNISWRKEYPTPPRIGADYKGTRTQADTYDWKYIYKSIRLLSNKLDSIGVTTSNAYGVEGDDWCWWWSRKLNAEGINVVLWTSDEDVKQLVQQDPSTGAFTAWYEKNKGVVFNESMKENETETDDIDFFMTPIHTKNVVMENLKNIMKVSYVNPLNIINKKIYVGDGGDNILPIFTYRKNGKTYKATQKDWEKIISINEGLFRDSDWESKLNRLYDRVYTIKYTGKEEMMTTPSDFVAHAVYNKKMVWLDESQIPANVQAQMISCEYKTITPQLLHDMTYNWRIMSTVAVSNDIDMLFKDPDNLVFS